MVHQGIKYVQIFPFLQYSETYLKCPNMGGALKGVLSAAGGTWWPLAPRALHNPPQRWPAVKTLCCIICKYLMKFTITFQTTAILHPCGHCKCKWFPVQFFVQPCLKLDCNTISSGVHKMQDLLKSPQLQSVPVQKEQHSGRFGSTWLQSAVQTSGVVEDNTYGRQGWHWSRPDHPPPPPHHHHHHCCQYHFCEHR